MRFPHLGQSRRTPCSFVHPVQQWEAAPRVTGSCWQTRFQALSGTGKGSGVIVVHHDETAEEIRAIARGNYLVRRPDFDRKNHWRGLNFLAEWLRRGGSPADSPTGSRGLLPRSGCTQARRKRLRRVRPLKDGAVGATTPSSDLEASARLGTDAVRAMRPSRFEWEWSRQLNSRTQLEKPESQSIVTHSFPSL
jgi:hypothetical protein